MPSTSLPRPARFVLALSLPIALGGLLAAVAGVLSADTYAEESSNWAAQAVGQDAVNLVIHPLLLVLAWRAARGDLRAYLGWLGLAAYSAYTYLLYAGYLHISGWFPVYVATFGLSVWALSVGLGILDPGRLRSTVTDAPLTMVGTTLVVLGGLFALLWLSELLPVVVDGEVPSSVEDAGLATNPVWILDLALILPAMIVGGTLLRRGRASGHLLAVPLLAFGIAMGAAIMGMQVVMLVRDEASTVVPLVMMAVVAAVEAVALVRYLRSVPDGPVLVTVLRDGSGGQVSSDRPTSTRTALTQIQTSVLTTATTSTSRTSHDQSWS